MSAHPHLQQQLLPLASAVVACRTRDLLTALPHVVEDVSTFVDCATPTRWSIKRTCARNGMTLLKRVATRESPSLDPYYRAFLASKGLAAAVHSDNLAIARWLCVAYCPSILPMEGIVGAATLNDLHLFQRLFGNTDVRPGFEWWLSVRLRRVILRPSNGYCPVASRAPK